MRKGRFSSVMETGSTIRALPGFSEFGGGSMASKG
jgi:hypothetical protein